MATKVFKLKFETPVHFGKKRLSDSEKTIASDTLFSAIFIEALLLKADLELLLNELLLSDTFPYFEDELYLPKPLLSVKTQHDDIDYKALKKIQYIPVLRYQDFIKGNLSSVEIKELSERLALGSYSMHTKVSLINVGTDGSGDSEPYSVGTFSYNPDAGLYFIAEGSAKSLDQLTTIMDSLQYSGLGGKRSAGYGRFSYTYTKDSSLENLLATSGNTFILLSTARGTETELKESSSNGRFILKKRTGFIQSIDFEQQLVKKKDFYSFIPGSVFKDKFAGAIYEVGENGAHPVYRNAKAMWLEVNV